MADGDWIEWDKKYVWHPFTQVKTELPPIPIVSAKGMDLVTNEGNVIKDMNASWWVNIFGHCHPNIVKAIQQQIQQMDQVIFAGITHRPAAELSKLLIEFTGFRYDKVFFSDNGSTSIEVALKMAMQFYHNQGTERKKVMALEGAYHGDTFGAMSVGERDYFNRPFERHFFEVEYLPLPSEENFKEVYKKAEKLLHSGEVYAFIFEPLVQGSSGMRMYSEKHLDELIHLCQKNEVLTIADEVMTGFGRTGKRLAIDHLKQVPDIICLSKGITGGSLPLGITLTGQRLYNIFLHDEKAKGFLHGHSYTGNAVIAAAAVATIKTWHEENIDQKLVEIENLYQSAIERLEKLDFIENIRLNGTILAFEYKTDGDSDYFHPKRDSLYRYFISQGLLIRPLGNTIFLMPPYCVTQDEIDKAITAVENIPTDY